MRINEKACLLRFEEVMVLVVISLGRLEKRILAIAAADTQEQFKLEVEAALQSIKFLQTSCDIHRN